MDISRDLAPDAIRKLFTSELTGRSGSLTARKLYRLWGSTGLRRQDLADGIMAMSGTRELESRMRDGECHFTLPLRPRRRGATRLPPGEAEERAQALAGLRPGQGPPGIMGIIAPTTSAATANTRSADRGRRDVSWPPCPWPSASGFSGLRSWCP